MPPSNSIITASSLEFLSQLKTNNHRAWFLDHKKEYEHTKIQFAGFIGSLIAAHGMKDVTISHLEAKDCLFRINRDVRFSKDKSPYKTNMGGSISAGGKKGNLAGYYFHLEPGASFVGGGLYMPEAVSLAKVRQEIDYNWEAFNQLLQHKQFKKTYGDLENNTEFKLQRVPKGYEQGNPASEYLKLKSFVAIKNLNDAEVLSPQLMKNTLEAFEALQPLLHFINQSLV